MADEIVYFLRVRHLYFRFARDGLFTRAEDEGELLCLVFRGVNCLYPVWDFLLLR